MTRANAANTRGYRDPGREKDDFYRTPEPATLALLSHESLPQRVWEPACGDGAISRVIERSGRAVVSTDLCARGYGAAGRDFLFERDLLAPAIVTNPPFKLADEFVLHALDLGAQFVAILQRLAWLEGDKRRRELWQRHPVSRVWVFSKRQTLWRGDDNAARATGGAIAFAWFVWQRPLTAETRLGWIA